MSTNLLLVLALFAFVILVLVTTIPALISASNDAKTGDADDGDFSKLITVLPALLSLPALDLLAPKKKFFDLTGFLITVVPLLVLASYLPAAQAFNMDYALGGGHFDMTLFAGITSITAATAAAMSNALGTDPRKNWDRILRIARAAGSGNSGIGLMFCMCHFSANPAVWEKILKALVADPTVVAFTDAAQFVIDLRKIITVCEWKKGGMPSTGRIMPQKVLNCNPTLAALTWCFVTVNTNITVNEFLQQRWAVALDLDAALKASCETLQTEFVVKSLAKTWDPKFFNIVKKSTFPLMDLLPNATAPTSIGRFEVGMYDRAKLVAWLNKINGTTLT